MAIIDPITGLPSSNTQNPTTGVVTSNLTSVPNASLQPSPQINLPSPKSDLNLATIQSVQANTPTPDVQKEIANTNNQELNYNKTSGNLNELNTSLANKSTEQIQLENTQGIPELNRNITDLQNIARQKTAEYQLVGQTTPYSLAGQGRGISTSLLRGQEATIQRQKQTSLAVDALVANSQLESARGNLTYAQNLVDRAISMKYDPIIAKIDAQNKILAENKYQLSRADQKLATAKQVENEAKKTALATEIQQKKDAITLASTAIANGTIDSTLGYKAISDLTNGKMPLATFYSDLGIQPNTTQNPQGNIGQRNNNPGNLKDPNTGAFRTFNTPEEGYQALEKDLLAKMTGATSTGLTANSSLLDFAKVYAPSSDNNNPTTYANNLAKQLGVTPTTKIGTLKSKVSDFAKAIAQNEGFNVPIPTKQIEQYGKLATTSFNPENKVDILAKQYLDNYIKNSTIPTMSSLGITARTGGGTPMFQKAQARASQLYYEATSQPLPDVQILKANKALVTGNNKLANNLNIQEDTVGRNFALSIQNLDKGNINQHSQPINAFLDKIKNLWGDPAVAQYLAQNTTVANEIGSLLAVKNASGTTVADKLEASGLVPKNASEEQQKAILKVLLQEAENAQSAIKDTSNALYSQIDPLAQDPNNPERNKILNPEGTDQSNIAIITKFRASSPENDKHAQFLKQQFPMATPAQIRQALNLPAYD